MISHGYSDYVRWYLKSEGRTSIKIGEPINWNSKDSLKMKRHEQYHGMLFSYTGNLQFTGDAMDYIEEAYVAGGVNAKCRLTKYVLMLKDGDVKWVEMYSFLADWETKNIANNRLTIKWNTFDLEGLIKSHESDEFEAERLDSIDGEPLEPLVLNKTEVSGRELNFGGQSRKATDAEGGIQTYYSPLVEFLEKTFRTTLLSEGAERHVSVDDDEATEANVTSSSMFYQAAENANTPPTKVTIRYELKGTGGGHDDHSGDVVVELRLMQWDGAANFTIVETRELFNVNSPIDERISWDLSGSETFTDVQWNQAVMIVYRAPLGIRCDLQNIWTNEISIHEASQDLDCIFVHDLFERFMYILTGEKDMFHSNYFGRTELNTLYEKYKVDGEGGLMAYIHGYWLRGFSKESDRYKSITTSIKNELANLKAVFNIGVTVESNGLVERLRIEELEYFYREKVVVKFPNQLKEVSRDVDGSLFFSAMKFGYSKADDYESDNGLDEPNQISNYVSPIRRSSNKFEMLSKTRADDTAMELTRRKNALNYPDEDTPRDEHIFFLDLKRIDGSNTYTQKIWSDRLKVLPEWIFSPETWKGMFFTPMRMAMRHSWIYRSGLEPYLEKDVKHINSTGNKRVITHAKDDWRIGEDLPISEDSDIKVVNLERARFLPELVTAQHAVSDWLLDWIYGTTEVVVNGVSEQVPNYYFKMEFINENGKRETGYLVSLDPSGNGQVTYQRANENLI